MITGELYTESNSMLTDFGIFGPVSMKPCDY